MNPSTRAVDVLRVLRDLRPEQARQYLTEASRALDQAELAVLARQLPAGLVVNDSQTAPTQLIDPASLPPRSEQRPPVRAPRASTLQIVRAALRPARWVQASLVLVGLAVGVGMGVFLRVQPFRASDPGRAAPSLPAPVVAKSAPLLPPLTLKAEPVVVNAHPPPPRKAPVKRADRDPFVEEF